MHSPWGLEYSIIKETGWTRRYLLWGETWVNIQMMLADAPAYRHQKKSTEPPPPKFTNADEELAAMEKLFNR